MAASTSYNQNPSSPPTSWDVFLSFRGEDTRNSFTSHLYKDLCRDGIKTFMDNPELRSGDVISESLIEAIQKSKTYIVVLSENYASSSWCLDELVEILRCHKTMNRLVVPVFYCIDPSVVRHRIGSFKEAFDKHQTRYNVEKVNNWRLTLEKVAAISGYPVPGKRSEAETVDEVVSRISLETNPKTLHVAAFKVGLDSRVKSLTTLFNSGTNGVIRIGIHGMGGVGKTTLAKEVFNQNYQRFQGSCFLANVREVSGMRNGIESLQQQLINNVLKRKDITIDNADHGIELIKARICSTKVLVVIDDLDNLEPLKYLEGSFALGSVVIITTRYEDLLDKVEVKAKYKLNQMDEDESLQLFTQHAFGKDGIPDTFTELSKKVLKHAGGLPLALRVFGSTLHNESENKWEWFIEQLKEAPIKDIEKNLMISFDALKSGDDSSLQEIFLDIACFYIGYSKDDVFGILKTFYTRVDQKIDILQKRCLITIRNGYEVDDLNYEDEVELLGMHDLLQDMGRKIARNNSLHEPGKHSRLWIPEDTKTVLKNRRGTDAIHAIICSLGWGPVKENEVVIDAESFKMMSKLKFLYLNNANLTGSFEQTFEDLRWLCWIYCPLECLPSKFCPQKLVELDLSYSKLRTMGEENMVFEKMKILSLGRSPNLTTTPDFNRFPWLETLNLGDCSSLEEVHTSVGTLVRLVSLNLEFCYNLRSLPDSICSLRALEVLIITACTSLEALPTELGSIESLKELHAYGLNVSKLPDSIGRLSNLVKLDLSQNRNLETLPDSMCSLRSLEILDISYCVKLEELPELGMITSLRILRIMDNTMLRMLPDISQVSNIKNCDLYRCSNLLSISDLPPNLVYINATDCCSLKRIPNLCNLKHLKMLNLTNCSGLTEIQGLEELTSLRELHLAGCRSSLQTCTLTKRFFELLSGFGHPVKIYIGRDNLESYRCRLDLGIQLELGSNASHNFMAFIIAFEDFHFLFGFTYWVKNTTSGGVEWNDWLHSTSSSESLIVIVPSSILSIRGGDKIEIKSDQRVISGIHQKVTCGIYLLYNTDNPMTSEDFSTTDNEEEERSHKRWKATSVFFD
ncbi:TMV resistance protein N-like [Apium graveolens]|uniref:TMV resistance protein N-like n=1 Tax=Apium graveolens TaxID=4045 RepID=UPI003D7B8F3A